MSGKKTLCAASAVVRGLALVLLSSLVNACSSQPPSTRSAANGAARAKPIAPATPRPAYAEADASYYRARASALATEAMDEVAGTDFWRFRRGRLYVPDASNIWELEARLADAAKNESAAGVVDATSAILLSDQADINAHTLRGAALRKTDHVSDADFHDSVAKSLVDSIIHAGDGRSAKSAWTAYRVKEEYEVLKALGSRFVSQSRITEGNRSFDVLDAEKVADGSKLRFYFDVTEALAEEARAAAH